MQQRGIPTAALEVLLEYGRETYNHRHGCQVVLFDKRCRRKLAERVGARGIRSVERYLDAYAVVAPDGAVVTVGHRFRKFEHV
jgi:hypothetical protein